MKTFNCSFPIDFAFWYVNTMPRTYNTARKNIFSVDFLVVIIYWYFLFVYMQKTYIAFICANPLLFLLSFIVFIFLLHFSTNFEFNFGLSFHTITLFHLNCFPSYQRTIIRPLRIGLENIRNMAVYWVGHEYINEKQL